MFREFSSGLVGSREGRTWSIADQLNNRLKKYANARRASVDRIVMTFALSAGIIVSGLS